MVREGARVQGREEPGGLVMYLHLLSADLESMDVYVDGEKEESCVSLIIRSLQ